jgi:oxygen-independent coproporphyrinogen-3 oxidase
VRTEYRHLYLHVPFCARRCSYCDFAIVVRRQVPVADFIASIRRELSLRVDPLAPPVLDTLYLGGGTPSRLGPDGIALLMDVVREHVTIASGAEVTLEANPEDITDDAVRAWMTAGVNRLSIGIQSFDDRVLRWMHRVHDADTARRAIDVARAAGLSSFSIDLIFSVPESLERDWARDLDEVLLIAAPHVSLYGLTIEPHTPLGHWRARGEVAESPEETYESDFLLAHHRLSAAGYDHYEVSNFSQAGARAVHNSAYWQGVPYLGVGPSAHGFDGRVRRWNIASYPAWGGALQAGKDPAEGEEMLTANNRQAESVYLGLRTSDGLRMSDATRSRVASWFTAGWLELVGDAENGRVRCTPTGWLRLDRLAADLTALPSHS